MTLTNRKILVTGANGGIGISICEILLKNDAHLILFYNKNRDNIDKFLQEHKSLASKIEIFKVDLINTDNLHQTLSQILKNGSIDTVIHSVTSTIENKRMPDLLWNDFELHINLQTKSFYEIAKDVIPSMKSNKFGKFINILTSYTVGTPPPSVSSYLVGKYSLLGLSKALSIELASYGITVNCVSPSMTDTRLIDNLPLKLKEINANQNPQKRLAKPNDVAETILFLCSKNSSFINGENIIISGGQVMH
jgi:3-oxoacyl-[acyl-carrier protein] reductase